jgi:hypothetical protein
MPKVLINDSRAERRVPSLMNAFRYFSAYGPTAMKPVIYTSAIFAVALALGACTQRTSYVDLYGQSVPVSGGERTIVINPDTRHVHVEGGETIRFVAGGKEFAWAFNVARSIHSFDLREVAPPGVLNHSVRAHVAPDPKYIGVTAGDI